MSPAAVREHRGGVSPHPSDTGALEGRVAEAALERLWVPVEQRRELRLGSCGAEAELDVARRARELHVPRTDVLAHVAPEQPLAHQLLLGIAELSGVLDGQVGDPTPRGVHSWCVECACRV